MQRNKAKFEPLRSVLPLIFRRVVLITALAGICALVVKTRLAEKNQQLCIEIKLICEGLDVETQDEVLSFNVPQGAELRDLLVAAQISSFKSENSSERCTLSLNHAMTLTLFPSGEVIVQPTQNKIMKTKIKP